MRLVSPDPWQRIRLNWMSHADDWGDMRACIRLMREIFAQPAFAPYVDEEIQPGDHVTTEAGIEAFIKDRFESAYHLCGTCRMGRADDSMAVVDEDTLVIGLRGMRVVDSSIVPSSRQAI